MIFERIPYHLYVIQGAIIRLKRRAKKEYGTRRDDWPVDVREHYERLTQAARKYRKEFAA